MGFLGYEKEPGGPRLQQEQEGFDGFHHRERYSLFMERSFTRKKMQIVNFRINYGKAIPVRHFLKRKISRPIYADFLPVHMYFSSISNSMYNPRTCMSLDTCQ